MSENIFSKILQVGEQSIGIDDMFEFRAENDGNGNPIYVGYSPTANAATDENVWFIRKFFYDGNNSIIRVQQPDDGIAFIYNWDSRNTYFS